MAGFPPHGSTPSPSWKEVGAASFPSHLLASHTRPSGEGVRVGLASPAARVVPVRQASRAGSWEEPPPPPPCSGPHPLSGRQPPRTLRPRPEHPPAALPHPSPGQGAVQEEPGHSPRLLLGAGSPPQAAPSGAPAGVRGAGCALGPCSLSGRSSRLHAGTKEGEGGLPETKSKTQPPPHPCLERLAFLQPRAAHRAHGAAPGLRACHKAAPPPGCSPFPSVAAPGRGQGRQGVGRTREAATLQPGPGEG